VGVKRSAADAGEPCSVGAASLDRNPRDWPSRSEQREKLRSHATGQIAISIAGGDKLVLVDPVDRPDVNRGSGVVHPDEPIDVVLLTEETAFYLSGPAAGDSRGRAHPGPVQTVQPDRLSVQDGRDVEEAGHGRILPSDAPRTSEIERTKTTLSAADECAGSGCRSRVIFSPLTASNKPCPSIDTTFTRSLPVPGSIAKPTLETHRSASPTPAATATVLASRGRQETVP